MSVVFCGKTWIHSAPPAVDVAYIAQNMQAADGREIYALRLDDDPASVVSQVMCGHGYRWTLGRGSQPLIAIGIEPMWPGVWSAWMFSTANMRRAGKAVTKLARDVILPIWADEGGHRLECWSHIEHEKAHRWLLALGAQREQVAKNYGKNGEDFACYVWRR